MYLRRHWLFKEEIVQRAECPVFFYLIDRHFLTVNRQLDETAPAIKLMGTDFPNVFGIAIRASHPFSPVTFHVGSL
jgi:hypothetical protein